MRLGIFPLLATLLIGGCASLQEEYEAPLTLTVSLDKEEYKIGEPVVATVIITNETRKDVTLVRFDVQTVRFLMTRKETFVNSYREPLQSKEVIPEMRQLKRGETFTRPFIFTQLTEAEGEYALISSFKGAYQKEELDTVFSKPIGYKVNPEVAFRRDKNNGLILKEQAIELAKKSIKGEVLEDRAVLVPMGQTGLFTWVIMIRYTGEDGKERRTTMHLDPYMGKIRPLELKEENVPAPQQKQEEKGK